MPPAARVGDMHACPMVTPGTPPVPHVGGPVIPAGCPTVLIGGAPAARVGDMATCVGPADVIVQGSPSVQIGGALSARVGDVSSHGGVVVAGCPSVLIGDLGLGRAEVHYRNVNEYGDHHARAADACLAQGDRHGAAGHKARITEAKGERETANLIADEWPEYELQRGFDQHSSCFDQVYFRYGPSGEIDEILIVEAKGNPRAKLGETRKGQQMSLSWVRLSAAEWKESPDPQKRKLGELITDALRSGVPRVRGSLFSIDAPNATAGIGDFTAYN
jgi:uncharacterized Zn-binding protein involved in type VI secretion